MANTVSVDFITKVVEIEVNDNETESLAAAASIAAAKSAALRADEAKKLINDNISDALTAIEDKADEEKGELDTYTNTKKAEIETFGQEEVQIYATQAAASAQSASETATQLADYIDTKETLTAPVIDPTISISGAGADAKVTGNVAKGLYEHNIYDIFCNNRRVNDACYTWHEDGSCTVVTDDSNQHFNNIYDNGNTFPFDVKPGGTYFIKYSSSKVALEIWKRKGSLSQLFSTKSNYIFTFPADAQGFFARLNVSGGTGPVNETVKPEMYSVEGEALRGALCNYGEYNEVAGALGLYGDANLINKNCVIAVTSGHTMLNAPYATGWLQTIISGTDKSHYASQIMYPYNNGQIIKYRSKLINGTWTDWRDLQYNTVRLVGDSRYYINSCDDANGNSVYFVSTDGGGVSYLSDFPINVGWLMTIDSNPDGNGSWKFQLAYPWTNYQTIMFRVKNSAGWTSWKTIGGGQVVNNTYETNHYTNTYNVTATPTITTDTNQYLAPTGDTTDVSANIQTLLSQTGVCHLGPGDFYVSGVDVPAGATLDGCGNATRIHLLDSVLDGYAVKLNENSTLKDVMLIGAASDITLLSTVGTRHGILWEGNANGDNNSIPYRGTISNVFIKRFSGGGITCTNTGYGTSGLNVSDCHITNCNAAINISYWSEFHRFTNINATYNYYGCINNGGNNMFVNCNFTSNKMGMLMDNSQGQSPNNTHGSAIGCVFNHTDGNTGIGIKILNCASGFIFEGCQIFYSQIYLEDTDGIVVSNSNFGANNCNITVKNGGAVLFNGNMHQAAPTVSITNNSHVVFANCYVRSTGAAVTA